MAITFLVSDFVAALVALIFVGYLFVQHRYGYWRRKGVYFQTPVFPLGSIKVSLTKRILFQKTVRDIYYGTNEPVAGMWTAFQPTLLIRDPELIKQVCIDDFKSFHDRGVYSNEKRDPLTGNLILLPGEKWSKLRNKLTPTFTSVKLKGMFPSFIECGGPLDAYLDKVATGLETIDVRDLLSRYSINGIASVAFGLQVDCISDPDSPFREFGKSFFKPSFPNALRLIVAYLYPKLFSWLGIKLFDCKLEDFIVNIVKNNMEHREKNNVSRRDFFQLLLQLRNTGSVQEDENWKSTESSETKILSFEQCAANALVFFQAGYESSSNAMSFVMYELAKNQECLKRAQREIDEVLANHNDELTYESVSEMKYLDWCIDEVLRMYASISIMNRQASRSWTIPNTNITIDKGTYIIIPAACIHLDPKYWPQPDVFIPERFSPQQSEGKTFNDRPFMPFGIGPRNCIGMRQGILQTKIGIIVMLRKYNYQLCEKRPMTLNANAFTMQPENGIHLRISHRSVGQIS